jgi:ABC-type lipoprotein export system ATPase subunit
MNLLIRLNRERDLTFLLVTHARRVAARCTRVVRMRDGQIQGEQTPQEVLAELSRIPSQAEEAAE